MRTDEENPTEWRFRKVKLVFFEASSLRVVNLVWNQCTFMPQKFHVSESLYIMEINTVNITWDVKTVDINFSLNIVSHCQATFRYWELGSTCHRSGKEIEWCTFYFKLGN